MTKPSKIFTAAALLLALLINSFAASAAEPAVVDAFKSAPQTLIPLLQNSARLDMLDYFNSGLDTPTSNLINGKSRIVELSDRSMKIDLTPASTLQIMVLPAANKEYFATISTIATPAQDSKLTIYSSDWQQTLTDKLFRTPQLKDWLTPEGRKMLKEIEIQVPFTLVSYDYNPDTQSLILHNNTSSILSREDYEDLKPMMIETLEYRWNGKKFEAVKQ
ncbi:MAG: DUF3256 family protein [Barnesiella sp.]|nr:DUF3256 family protein [Barnesiella sp.]